MNNQHQMEALKKQISSNETKIRSLYKQNHSYQDSYDNGLSTIRNLEAKLEALLYNKRNLVRELIQLERLTIGERSPMGKISFVEAGVLEGRALETMQDRIIALRRQQRLTMHNLSEADYQIDKKITTIEQQIEEQRTSLMELDRWMADNRYRMQVLKSEIASARQSLHTL
ncbi:hypothetical protein SAMN05421736_1383 [Evansella caseinilytica]|uniref:Uncharacterized protein n=1 Tax=Evansella caseinilytica TaxID=1503961 RepID=A0A1H3V282_9BACI|nr:hypothetical protein [Evansella caseinilytica]SDZ68698.1 hypothetical protein SAMN05421736_1383 [Evansella caseinilytica]